MTDRLRTLYRDLVLDHGRRPRHRATMAGADRVGEGHNPLCGDRVRVMLRLGPQGVVAAAQFTGEGCAISTASASVLTELVSGLTLEQAGALASRFEAALSGEPVPDLPEALEALTGVVAWPARVRCARLPWVALGQALSDESEVATSEP